ncbi:MAG: ferredoxin [Desulfohalobium sp.]
MLYTMNTLVTDISIDPIACTGCESCAELCPACFAMQDETGLAVVVEPHPEAIPDCLQEAVSCCPTQCIAVEYTEPGNS